MNLILVAADTIKACENGSYAGPKGDIDIQGDLAKSMAETKFISSDFKFKIDYLDEEFYTSIEITDETTDTAGRRLAFNGDNVVVLNFADAICPGGGFLKGSKAQEECLCRVSGLFFCLKQERMNNYYKINEESLFDGDIPKDRLIRNNYTDNIIYSPKVPFFRDKDYNWLAESANLSVITSPAPYCGDLKEESERTSVAIYSIFLSRMEKIFNIALEFGHKKIIIGAWGCGAFGNSPEVVASCFKDILNNKFKNCFKEVVFAIPNIESKNHKTFKKILG